MYLYLLCSQVYLAILHWVHFDFISLCSQSDVLYVEQNMFAMSMLPFLPYFHATFVYTDIKTDNINDTPPKKKEKEKEKKKKK